MEPQALREKKTTLATRKTVIVTSSPATTLRVLPIAVSVRSELVHVVPLFLVAETNSFWYAWYATEINL